MRFCSQVYCISFVLGLSEFYLFSTCVSISSLSYLFFLIFKKINTQLLGKNWSLSHVHMHTHTHTGSWSCCVTSTNVAISTLTFILLLLHLPRTKSQRSGTLQHNWWVVCYFLGKLRYLPLTKERAAIVRDTYRGMPSDSACISKVSTTHSHLN